MYALYKFTRIHKWGIIRLTLSYELSIHVSFTIEILLHQLRILRSTSWPQLDSILLHADFRQMRILLLFIQRIIVKSVNMTVHLDVCRIRPRNCRRKFSAIFMLFIVQSLILDTVDVFVITRIESWPTLSLVHAVIWSWLFTFPVVTIALMIDGHWECIRNCGGRIIACQIVNGTSTYSEYIDVNACVW